ncbi:MAG TPA: FAD-dependent oxidoreductase [Thermoleophilaceae bacterium]|nr:FAD-dependent oxidoreductase [Thermoleophilaceae bacterium]
MRVAVVGAGVSGLSCAYRLAREHEVTVFEAAGYAGGHANTVRVDLPDETHWVDTGFIVLNDRNYPNFERLLGELGVATQPSDMSFSVSDEHGGLEYNGASANGLFADRANLVRPRFLRMLRDLLRFNREAPALVGLNGSGPSLGAFLDDGGYSREFVDQLIVPQASAVWSADPAQMWSFPASMLAEFFHNHGMFGLGGRPKWRTVVGGSHRYVEKIAKPLGERLRLSTPVTRVERFEDRVEVTPAGGGPEEFEEVVLATHSDQSLALLADPTDAEAEVLGAVAYQPNEAVLHTDRSLLPRRRRAWASWNFHLLDEPVAQSTVTYRMNSLQSLRSGHEICVTLNRTERIDPAKIIGRYGYAHPVFTHAALAAQRRWEEVSGRNRTHYCGAWWGYGFHEDGVKSALKVCESLERGAIPA